MPKVTRLTKKMMPSWTPALMVAGVMVTGVILLKTPGADAAIDVYAEAQALDGEQKARYESLIDELRCPQCLNISLAGSDAMIARDLRREVHRMLLAGKSDAEILEFMYQRYGDFILYRPRFKLSTLLLWLGPLMFLGIALLVLWRMIPGLRAQTDHTRLSRDQQTRLDALLKKAE